LPQWPCHQSRSRSETGDGAPTHSSQYIARPAATVLSVRGHHSGSVRDPALIERMAPTGSNPDGYAHLTSLADDIDWWVAHAYVQTRIDAAEVVDNSFADYAIERLGRYATQ
jgi:hypothetical protein